MKAISRIWLDRMRRVLPELSADDIFISYSRRDGNTYAVGLADALTRRGFSCFLDKLGTDADSDLPPSLTRKVRSCAMLVVIGSAAASASPFVAQEVDEFAHAHGTSRAVPIYFGDPGAGGGWQRTLVGIAPEVEDPAALETGNPSVGVVNRIEKSFNYVRSKDRLRRYTIGAAVTLALLVLGSVVAGIVARNQFALARTATREADAARADAKQQQERAKEERAKADRAALNARAAGLVSVARGMADSDPLTASLLLTEASGPTEPSGGVAAARDLLSRYVTKTTLRGHSKSSNTLVGISDVAFSPDGSRLVTAGGDGTARVWTNQRSPQSIVLDAQEGELVSAKFSPDGTRVATASRRSVRVWNADGTGLPVLLPGSEGAEAALFSPDGQSVLSYGRNRATVHHLDGTGPVTTFEHPDYVACATFSPDGGHVITGSGDGNARIWKADRPANPIVLRGGGGTVVACGFSPDGQSVAIGALTGGARVFRADGTGQPAVLGRPNAQAQEVEFSPDGKRVAIMPFGEPLQIWPATGTGQPVRISPPAGIGGPAHTIRFSRDGKRLLISWHSGLAELWNADGGGPPIVLRGHQDSLSAAAFSPDEREIVTASYDGTARIWTRALRDDPLVLPGGSNFEAHFSPDGRRVVSFLRRSDPTQPPAKSGAFVEQAVEHVGVVWNADGSGEPALLRGHTDTIAQARFSPDSTRVLTSSFDGTTRIWWLDGKTPPVVLGGKDGAVRKAEFSPDGTHVLTAIDQVKKGEHASSVDGTLRVWSADGTGDPVILHGHQGAIGSMAFSPDGRRIVSAGEDGTVRVWSSSGVGEPVVLRGHQYKATAARFDLSGRRIVSAAEDKTAILQNADGSGQPQVWKAGVALKSVEFSPDGGHIVMLGENERDVFLWHTAEGLTVQTLHGHTSFVNNARFSTDGAYLVTSSRDGSARVWRTDGTGEPLLLQSGDNDDVYWAEFSTDQTRVLTVTSPSLAVNLTARIWSVGWTELVSQLRARTSECLRVEQRLRYLGESPATAADRFAECERGFGRSPPAK